MSSTLPRRSYFFAFISACVHGIRAEGEKKKKKWTISIYPCAPSIILRASLRIGKVPIGSRERLRDTRTKPSIRDSIPMRVYVQRLLVAWKEREGGGWTPSRALCEPKVERERWQSFRFVAGKYSIFLAIGKRGGSFSFAATRERWNMTASGECVECENDGLDWIVYASARGKTGTPFPRVWFVAWSSHDSSVAPTQESNI